METYNYLLIAIIYYVKYFIFVNNVIYKEI